MNTSVGAQEDVRIRAVDDLTHADPCLGMKFAKVEANLVIALWLAYFDSSLADGKDVPLKQVPQQTRDHTAAAPPDTPMRLLYKRK